MNAGIALFFSVAVCAHAAPDVRILISDEAGIAEGELRIAVDTARRVLESAGVAFAWGGEHADLTVRIVAEPLPGHTVGAAAMGLSLLGGPNELSTFAYVYYNRVGRLAAAGGCERFRLLGHVIAHEIGHLLSVEHSWRGIMRAEWSRSELVRMRTGYLVFSADEAKTMRRNVGRRAPARRASR